jgi:hypothetical protein
MFSLSRHRPVPDSLNNSACCRAHFYNQPLKRVLADEGALQLSLGMARIAL